MNLKTVFEAGFLNFHSFSDKTIIVFSFFSPEADYQSTKMGIGFFRFNLSMNSWKSAVLDLHMCSNKRISEQRLIYLYRYIRKEKKRTVSNLLPFCSISVFIPHLLDKMVYPWK